MPEGELGRIYSDGEIICREGDRGDMMYVVQSGEVEITKKTQSGEMGVATLGKGEIFGEMALFDNLPRSATVIASGSTRVLSIDKKKLFQTINRDPTLVLKLLDSMSKRIRTLTENLTQFKKSKSELLHLYTNIEKTCKLILEEAGDIIPADNGSIMILDFKDNSLTIMSAFGVESESKIRLIPGEGIAGDVLKTGKAELINNVSMDSRFVSGKMNIKSLLCVPLKSKDHIFGVINLSNNTEKLFTIDDLKLLRSLALYASIAIINAKSFVELNSATDEILRHATMLDIR
jgi:CRP-like cAMP-binding protein